MIRTGLQPRIPGPPMYATKQTGSRVEADKMGVAAIVFAGITAIAAPTSKEYVPGLSCEEVGGFAEQVALMKMQGETMEDQIGGMRQSIPGSTDTQAALEKIIRAIYADNAAVGKAPAERVGQAYERACRLFQ